MMNVEIFLALVTFSFVASITPGPNNLMLFASGMNFGYQRTIPHILGIAAGFFLMLVSVGLGLGQLLERFPLVYQGLKFAGGAYLLHLAWRIANAGPLEAGEGRGRPMRFYEAVAFQWVNPKAWVMAVTAMAAYSDGAKFLASIGIIAVTFTLINLPCVSTWAVFGAGLKRFLSNRRTLRLFNVAMALALVASLWPMLR
jgi:threonine/homoserine/homoserine lactone efflux protein